MGEEAAQAAKSRQRDEFIAKLRLSTRKKPFRAQQLNRVHPFPLTVPSFSKRPPPAARANTPSSETLPRHSALALAWQLTDTPLR